MIIDTRFGFIWNNLHVERLCEDRTGVYLYLCTNNKEIEIRIKPGGAIVCGNVQKVEKGPQEDLDKGEHKERQSASSLTDLFEGEICLLHETGKDMGMIDVLGIGGKACSPPETVVKGSI